MLKHGEINPLNVSGHRQLTHCPPHFCRVVFDLATKEKNISDWVYENLQGRFWIGQVFDDDSKMKACVAFEVHSEASYFSLFLDQFNAWDYNLLT